MQADLQANDIVFHRLRDCKAVCIASSEEQTDMVDMGGRDYSVSHGAHAVVQKLMLLQRCTSIMQVAHDPLDGSSVISANFAGWSP